MVAENVLDKFVQQSMQGSHWYFFKFFMILYQKIIILHFFGLLDQILCQLYATLGGLARQDKKAIFLRLKSILVKNSSNSSMLRVEK